METPDTLKKVKQKKFTWFVGIDVSKNELDYAVFHKKKILFHLESKNEPEDILKFVGMLKELSGFRLTNTVFCMEDTGFYCNHLLKLLKNIRAHIVVEHPLQIKRSLGLVREKTDKADAIKIAIYAQKNIDDLRFWEARRPVMVLLNSLFTLRNRMLRTSVALNTPLMEQGTFTDKHSQAQMAQLCSKTISAVQADLNTIELTIETVINSDRQLKRFKQLITSITGIGSVTAIQILLSTNEFKDIGTPEKFAVYAGVAPLKKESGKTFRRARVSTFANRKMKSLLHVCALSAIRYDEELRIYYERKTKEEKKPKLSVINAVRFKLILRVFACIKQDRPYVKNYVRPKNTAAGELVKYSSLQA